MNHMALRKYNGSDKCAVHGITEPLYYEVFQMFSKDNVQLIFEEGAGVGWIYLSLPEGTLSSGFDCSASNSCLVHDSNRIAAPTEGIRVCRAENYPTVPDIWSREHAAMHVYQKIDYADQSRECVAVKNRI